MIRRFAPLLALLLVAGCGTGPALSRTRPQICLATDSLDFGTVNLDEYRTRPFSIENCGSGFLTINGLELVEGDSDIFRLPLTPIEIRSGEPLELALTYIPLVERPDAATVRVLSDAIDEPVIEFSLTGSGVTPRMSLSVDDTLMFSTAPPAADDSQSLVVSSTGTGTLVLQDTLVYDPSDTFTAVASEALPAELAPGSSLTLTVSADLEVGQFLEASLQLLSNARNLPDPVIDLLAEDDSDPSNTPPTVEIIDPPSGTAVQGDEPIELLVQVLDEQSPSSSLVVNCSSSLSGGFATGFPDSEGYVTASRPFLDSGTHSVTCSAEDPAGASGSDSVSLLVWSDEEPLVYTISGGESPFHYLAVDDDLTVYVNDIPVFSDADGEQNLHAPIEFEARRGDTLRIQATDVRACNAALGVLTLYVSESISQPLVSEGIALSACEDNENYDGTYLGPWPNVFFEQSWTVSIP